MHGHMNVKTHQQHIPVILLFYLLLKGVCLAAIHEHPDLESDIARRKARRSQRRIVPIN
jgi:hypothetical protein